MSEQIKREVAEARRHIAERGAPVTAPGRNYFADAHIIEVRDGLGGLVERWQAEDSLSIVAELKAIQNDSARLMEQIAQSYANPREADAAGEALDALAALVSATDNGLSKGAVLDMARSILRRAGRLS